MIPLTFCSQAGHSRWDFTGRIAVGIVLSYAIFITYDSWHQTRLARHAEARAPRLTKEQREKVTAILESARALEDEERAKILASLREEPVASDAWSSEDVPPRFPPAIPLDVVASASSPSTSSTSSSSQDEEGATSVLTSDEGREKRTLRFFKTAVTGAFPASADPPPEERKSFLSELVVVQGAKAAYLKLTGEAKTQEEIDAELDARRRIAGDYQKSGGIIPVLRFFFSPFLSWGRPTKVISVEEQQETMRARNEVPYTQEDVGCL